ncbi:MAG: hypothetical protein DRO23_08435 [Thermoprotei archaeon]|mgnify:CR=1 FL=1|nr:MAG: hypothetical protein DRO23_08435 [Thermoprotei archaeon]
MSIFEVKEYSNVEEFLKDLKNRIENVRRDVVKYLKKVDEVSRAAKREMFLRAALSRHGIRLPMVPRTPTLELTEDSTLIIDLKPQDLSPVYEEISDKLQEIVEKLSRIRDVMENLKIINAPIEVYYENGIPKYIIVKLRTLEEI